MITGLLFDLFRGLLKLIQMVLGLLFSAIDSVFKVDQFGISLNTFENILGGKVTSSTDSILSYPAGSARFNGLLSIMRNIGFFSGLIIFAFSFFLLLVKGLHDTKDTLPSLVARMMIVAILAGASPYIAAGFSDIGSKFYDNVDTALNNQIFKSDYADTLMKDNKDYQEAKTDENLSFIGRIHQDIKDYKDSDEKSSDDDTSAEVSDDKKKSAVKDMIGTIDAGTLADDTLATFLTFVPGTGAVLIIISIVVLVVRVIFILIVLYNYLKLVIELLRRYMAYAVTYLMFPAVVGTLASGATSQIFWTWLRSLVSSMIALIITHVWLTLTRLIYSVMPMDLLGTFVIVAFISIGLNIEQFMRDRGFTMSAAGGRLLDSMMSSAFMVTRLARTARDGLGSITGGVSALTGNVPLMRAANVMNGRGAGVAEAMKRMNDSPLSAIRKAGADALKKGMGSDNKFKNAAAHGIQHAFNARTDRPEMEGMSSLQQKALEALRMNDMPAVNEAFDAMSSKERAEFASLAAGSVMDDKDLFSEMLGEMNPDDQAAFIDSHAMEALESGNMTALNTMLDHASPEMKDAFATGDLAQQALADGNTKALGAIIGNASQDAINSMATGDFARQAIAAGNTNALASVLNKASPEAVDAAVSNGLAKDAVTAGESKALNTMLGKASPEAINAAVSNGLAQEAYASGSTAMLNNVLSKASPETIDSVASNGLAKEALQSGNTKALNSIIGSMSPDAQSSMIQSLASDSYYSGNTRALSTMMSGMTGDEKTAFAQSIGHSVTSGSGESGFANVTGLGNLRVNDVSGGSSSGVFASVNSNGETQVMGSGGINITGMDNYGNIVGNIETPIGTTRMSITSAPTERGSNIAFTAGDGSTKYVQTGDTTPNTISMSKYGGVNLSTFGDSLPTDNSSPVTYQTKFSSSTIQSFATSIGKDMAEVGATNFNTQDAAHYTYGMVKNNRGQEEPTITATYGNNTYAIHQRSNGTIYSTGFRDDVAKKLEQGSYSGSNANHGDSRWAKKPPKPRTTSGKSRRDSD